MVGSLFVVSPIVCWGCGFEPCSVIKFLVSFLVYNNPSEEKRACCFTFILH